MNVLGLCSGVGGLELGIRIAEPGARCVAHVEREAYAAAVLVARMEDGWLHPAPVWSDLGTFDPEPWRGVVDCVASGDPCQPNSVAGKKLGEADERWLGDQVLRVFDRSGAARLFRENVTGNADGQLAFFVPALERMGCRVAAGVFSAEEAGGSHQRERLFIMADRPPCGTERLSTGQRRPELAAADPDGDCKNLAHDHGRGQRERADEPQRQRPEGRRGLALASDGSTVADSAGLLRRAVVGGEPDGACEFVGHPPLVGRREGRPEFSGQQREPSSDEPSSTGVGLADAERGGPGEVRDQRGYATNEGPIGEGGSWRDALPLFAPGPTDPRWPAILARASHLEPAVRRMAHGLAHRMDRLRACGNGVFPMAAANAWLALDARLRSGF